MRGQDVGVCSTGDMVHQHGGMKLRGGGRG